MTQRKIFIFLGPPGSGKGTQSDMLSEKINLPVISAGELLRLAVKKDKIIGPKVAKIIDKGKLVPDKIIFDLISKRAKRADAKAGFLLDGYPRHGGQLKHLFKLLKSNDKIYALEIKVGKREAVRRIGGRRVCDCGASYHLFYNPPKKKNICDICGKKLYRRRDDTSEVIKARMDRYLSWTKPLLSHFSKNKSLIIINGEQSIEQVRKEIDEKVKKL